MRRLLLLLFLLPIFSCFAQAEKNACQNKEKYRIAFNYIILDSVNTDKTIYVIDSIADLDKQWFREEINLSFGESKTIEDYFKFTWKESRYSPILASLYSDYKSNISDKVLIFSDIDDNMIVAEIWNRKRTANGQVDTINEIAWVGRFTEGYIYLFIFNAEGNIKDVFRKSYTSD